MTGSVQYIIIAEGDMAGFLLPASLLRCRKTKPYQGETPKRPPTGGLS